MIGRKLLEPAVGVAATVVGAAVVVEVVVKTAVVGWVEEEELVDAVVALTAADVEETTAAGDAAASSLTVFAATTGDSSGVGDAGEIGDAAGVVTADGGCAARLCELESLVGAGTASRPAATLTLGVAGCKELAWGAEPLDVLGKAGLAPESAEASTGAKSVSPVSAGSA